MEVYCASPLIPFEWIKAHGLEPRPVWLESAEGLPAPSAGMCAFAHQAGWLARRSDAPMIFPTHCDQLRRCFDSAGQNAFLFNLPATWRTPAACQMFRSELGRLGRFLVNLGGQAPSPARLREVIGQSSRARAALLAAAPALSGRAFAQAVAQFHCGGDNLRLAGFSVGVGCCDALPTGMSAERQTGMSALQAQDSPAIALIGGPLPPARWDLFDIIDNAGGRIALNATECGEPSLLPVVELDSGDPAEALARACASDRVAVYHRPNTPLYDWLRPRLAQRRIRGIVLWSHVGCDLWRAEAQSLREAFGLPVLLIDNSETSTGSARTQTRLEAFLDILKGR